MSHNMTVIGGASLVSLGDHARPLARGEPAKAERTEIFMMVVLKIAQVHRVEFGWPHHD
jgi:hypothetical protein